MRKIMYWAMFVVLVMVGVFVWQWPKDEVVVTVCDVGQGDGVIVADGFSQLLVDVGPPGRAMISCLGKVLPFWDRQIETITLSHTDSDHSGGLLEVLRHYRVKQVIVSESAVEKIQAMLPRYTKIVVSGQGDKWQFGNILGVVMWPPRTNVGNEKEDRNTNSLVWRMEYGKDSVWFAGDTDSSIETALLASGLVVPTTYLKVSHHGSKTATSDRFLGILLPHQAWISVGQKNRYGHPHQEVTDRLENMEISIWRTDQQHQFQFRLSDK